MATVLRWLAMAVPLIVLEQLVLYKTFGHSADAVIVVAVLAMLTGAGVALLIGCKEGE